MNSILSYPDRGKWGNSQYRGNCSGYVIKDLLQFYFPNNPPKQFIEVFSGGGTGQDVARDLGITNSIHLDLRNGWDALVDELPKGSDFTFSHPPYWDIIKYETQRGSFHEDDLSNQMDYETFIFQLDKVNEKIYHNLFNGGRHALLVGDVRKKGKYYSIIKDMSWFGDLESHLIKMQHNTKCEHKQYAHSQFIPIAHEHLLVFKKNQIWQLNVKYTKDFTKDIRTLKRITWKDLIKATLEYKEKASIQEIYEYLYPSEKAKANQHVRAKIRQVLNSYPDFQKQGDYWYMRL